MQTFILKNANAINVSYAESFIRYYKYLQDLKNFINCKEEIDNLAKIVNFEAPIKAPIIQIHEDYGSRELSFKMTTVGYSLETEKAVNSFLEIKNRFDNPKIIEFKFKGLPYQVDETVTSVLSPDYIIEVSPSSLFREVARIKMDIFEKQMKELNISLKSTEDKIKRATVKTGLRGGTITFDESDFEEIVNRINALHTYPANPVDISNI